MTRKRKIINTIKVLFILLILGVGFYPSLSDAWNRYVASKMISDYQQTIDTVDDSYIKDEREKAKKYNEQLNAGNKDLADYAERIAGLSGESNIEEGDPTYESLLNIDKDEVMGWIDIPKIDVKLPVLHYTNDEVLARGVGHLYGTSLPIGGENTHSILSGHRGLPTAKLFTDLNKIETGDEFSLNVLGENLYYKVVDIQTVLPYETDSLVIQPGKDLLTLVTCTPYGVNTHRLLVTGERIEKPQPVSKPPVQIIKETFHIPWVILGMVIFVLITAVIVLIYIWTRKNRQEAVNEAHRSS